MSWTEEFLKIYYWDDILSIAAEWPDINSLVIDSRDLCKYSVESWDLLSEKPDQVLFELESGIRDMPIPIYVDGWSPMIRISNHEKYFRIRDIRTNLINQLISVSGLVQKISTVRPRIIKACFECQRCGEMTIIPQSGHMFLEPLECSNEMCGRKGPFKLVFEQSEMIDTQKIRLQESPEDLKGGEQPQILDIQVDGDITGIVVPGNRISVTGILRIFQKIKNNKKTTQFDEILDGIYIQIDDSETDVAVSREDMEIISEMSQHPDIVEKLVSMFATSIYGYDAIKESLLVCAISGENVVSMDGTVQRGYAHMVICGDPSTAKSTLLKSLNSIIPRAQYATGDGASRIGLTAAVVKDDFNDGSYSIEAGALVLADKAVGIIDELDKIRRSDIPLLNTVLSSSQVHINKAGINTTLRARCPIICAMNPAMGRFNPHEDISSQIKIRSDTLSRFDLVYLMRDVPKREIDKKVTDILMNAWCCEKNDLEYSNVELLKKYLSVSRSISNVIVSENAQNRIKEYYLDLRNKYDENEGVIQITSRNLEALIRLSRSEAKLRLSHIADIQDVERAITLINVSREQTCIDDEGRLDSDIIEVGAGKSQRDRIHNVLKMISELQNDNYNGCTFADLAINADNQNISANSLNNIIDELKKTGKIFEPFENTYKIV